MKTNPYESQHATHERQGGGNRPARGERHNSQKARQITEDRRFGKVPHSNSPGRVNEDASGKDKK